MGPAKYGIWSNARGRFLTRIGSKAVAWWTSVAEAEQALVAAGYVSSTNSSIRRSAYVALAPSGT